MNLKEILRTTTFLQTSYDLLTFKNALLNIDVNNYPYLTYFIQIDILN